MSNKFSFLTRHNENAAKTSRSRIRNFFRLFLECCSALFREGVFASQSRTTACSWCVSSGGTDSSRSSNSAVVMSQLRRKTSQPWCASWTNAIKMERARVELKPKELEPRWSLTQLNSPSLLRALLLHWALTCFLASPLSLHSQGSVKHWFINCEPDFYARSFEPEPEPEPGLVPPPECNNKNEDVEVKVVVPWCCCC